MNDERYKQLMEQVGMPNSRSLLLALKQVANEVAQRQPKSEWISVNERLPEYGVTVLVFWRPIDYKSRPFHREIIIAARSVHLPDGGQSLESDQWWANGRYYDTATFITHWQQLPSPPKDNDLNGR